MKVCNTSSTKDIGPNPTVGAIKIKESLEVSKLLISI